MLAEFLLTAYHLGCDAPGPYTKTGTRPRSGRTVAVDPQVIPLGSVLEIEGLGFRIAEDIGGGVRGHHVDVYLGSCKEAKMFGRQKRKVQVHLRGKLRTELEAAGFEQAFRLALKHNRQWRLFFVHPLGVVWAKRFRGGLMLRDEPKPPLRFLRGARHGRR